MFKEDTSQYFVTPDTSPLMSISPENYVSWSGSQQVVPAATGVKDLFSEIFGIWSASQQSANQVGAYPPLPLPPPSLQSGSNTALIIGGMAVLGAGVYFLMSPSKKTARRRK